MMKKDVKKSSLKSKLKLLIVTGLAIAAISTITIGISGIVLKFILFTIYGTTMFFNVLENSYKGLVIFRNTRAKQITFCKVTETG